MKKKSVNLVTAVGVLVILSGAYVGVKTYGAKQDEKEEESNEEDNQEVVSIASEDIQSIRFVLDKKEVTFEKDGDSWVKSDECNFPVDQDKLDTLAGVFSSVTAQRTLKDVVDLSEYELDNPQNTITVTTTDGTTTVVQVGMENDSTSQEYIDLDNDSSTVYVVSNSTFQSFEGTLYDFAKSGTFPTVDSSTVSKIAVDGKDSSYVVEKDENNFWNITSDGETEKADSAKATSLASSLSSLAYASYVNYNCSESELAQYGLDKPYAEITVDYQEEAPDEENTEDVESADSAAATDDAAADDTAIDSTETRETIEDDAVADDAAIGSTEIDGTTADDTTADDVIADDTTANEVASDGVDTDSVSVGTDFEEVSETESEPVIIDKQLVIQVGDQSPDGNRYVRVNDSNEIYTISEDSLDTFLGKTDADFWDLTVSYLSVNNLEKLSVNYSGIQYDINVSRETSEDEDEENSNSTATTTLSYKMNGKELDSTSFTTFYNKLINMAAQKRLTDEFKTNNDPEMTAEFTDMDGNTMTVSYYSYDTNYYAAVKDDGKVYLVNKMTVKELLTSFETIAEEQNVDKTDAVDAASKDMAFADETENSETTESTTVDDSVAEDEENTGDTDKDA